MRLTIEEATAFINFVRRADSEGQLSSVDCWGSGDTGSSSDEWGDDPYYEWVTLHFMDGEEEEHEISFSDTTCHFAHEAREISYLCSGSSLYGLGTKDF